MFVGTFTSGNYESTLEIGFGENKYVAKISLKYKNLNSNNTSTGSYSFTNYNSTENVTISDTLLNDAKNSTVNYITSCSRASVISSRIEIGDNWAQEIEAFFSSLNASNVESVILNEKGTSNKFYEITIINSTITIAGTEYEFSSLSTSDNGSILSFSTTDSNVLIAFTR